MLPARGNAVTQHERGRAVNVRARDLIARRRATTCVRSPSSCQLRHGPPPQAPPSPGWPASPSMAMATSCKCNHRRLASPPNGFVMPSRDRRACAASLPPKRSHHWRAQMARDEGCCKTNLCRANTVVTSPGKGSHPTCVCPGMLAHTHGLDDANRIIMQHAPTTQHNTAQLHAPQPITASAPHTPCAARLAPPTRTAHGHAIGATTDLGRGPSKARRATQLACVPPDDLAGTIASICDRILCDTTIVNGTVVAHVVGTPRTPYLAPHPSHAHGSGPGAVSARSRRMSTRPPHSQLGWPCAATPAAATQVRVCVRARAPRSLPPHHRHSRSTCDRRCPTHVIPLGMCICPPNSEPLAHPTAHTTTTLRHRPCRIAPPPYVCVGRATVLLPQHNPRRNTASPTPPTLCRNNAGGVAASHMPRHWGARGTTQIVVSPEPCNHGARQPTLPPRRARQRPYGVPRRTLPHLAKLAHTTTRTHARLPLARSSA